MSGELLDRDRIFWGGFGTEAPRIESVVAEMLVTMFVPGGQQSRGLNDVGCANDELLPYSMDGNWPGVWVGNW